MSIWIKPLPFCWGITDLSETALCGSVSLSGYQRHPEGLLSADHWAHSSSVGLEGLTMFSCNSSQVLLMWATLGILG